MRVTKKVAVVGQGIVGCSTALCFLEQFPSAQITVFGCHDFENVCSYGSAGLFRFDKYEVKEWARVSFERFAYLEREYGPKTGIKLVSGHIQSDVREILEGQEKNYSDIVYNFRWLTDREISMMFDNPSKYAIHYTCYAAEGRKYVPWLVEQLKQKGATFVKRDFKSLDEVNREGFEFIFNCAGLNGGKLAEDDDSVVPIRGVIMEVEAPWHHHVPNNSWIHLLVCFQFNYRDFTTFTIPMSHSVALGTLKQWGRSDMQITDADREEIWGRYLQLHPKFKDVKVLSEWIALRPEREHVRLEHQQRTSADGRQFHVVHNYGHGGAGITLSHGCAVEAVKIMAQNFE